MKKEIHKIIKENFELNKNTIPWDGMYDEAVRKLLKLFEKKYLITREGNFEGSNILIEKKKY